MANTSGDGPIALQQTGKRDALKAIEKLYQQRWEESRVFEVNPPTPAEVADLSPQEVQEKFPKWFGTFPYPYMNGSLHLGHAFTISKIEFGCGYQRMLGKRALFPHGFHVTGMPIKAASDKIIREMEMFGQDFENFKPDVEDSSTAEASPAPVSSAPNADKDAKDGATKEPSKAKKGKIVAKSTGHKYQFQIMASIGVPLTEIKKFADPQYWLTYFPPIAIADQKSLGTRIDWRRSFLTTDANPYYDAFVRWQTNKLYRLDKIKFGERYTVYSPKDGQPCMDHDRSEGEALGPQEYTAIKMRVTSLSETAQSSLSSEVQGKIKEGKLFLVAATLRPETMYGQTNCFVGPSIKYGIFKAKGGDLVVCTERAARNMAFQGIMEESGKVEKVAELEGKAWVGTKVHAPMAILQEVYVLPMDGVLATKGTGVVTSVPSDSPDDFATLADLKKKPAFYNIAPEWVSGLEPIPVLSTPTYGNLTAPTLVSQLKINSQKDTKQLAEAKELAYKEGFYQGTMLVGEFKDMSVQDAKSKVRDAMIKNGEAMPYAEPEGFILSRSGDECVIALMDQWYLDYGEATWKAQAEKLLSRMNTYGTETRNGFEGVLAWLNKWACARTYGLGTKLPWDHTFMVESLSDSTIYMSYYTIAHLLHETRDGSKPGPLGITPDQMTDEVFEYILCSGPWPTNAPMPQEKADAMKREFDYFYPMDIRSSGKDLIPNHLTFAIYCHAAIFPEEKWPLSMRTNGHLMLNGKKMSKSTGNSLTLRESVEKFGADPTRISLADAGDSIEDANFDEKNANANILRLHTLIDWCEEMVAAKEKGELKSNSEKGYHEVVFENEINDLIAQTKAAYEATNYKEALKSGFYEMQMARDWYREVTSTSSSSTSGMSASLVLYWIRVSALLIAPIAPHFAEHIWSSPTILAQSTSIQTARWPTPSIPVDASVLASGQYMRGTLKTMRESEGNMLKKLAKSKTAPYDPKKPKSVRIYVASRFPEWQDKVAACVKESWDGEKESVDDVKMRELLTKEGLIKDKRAMPFAQVFKKRIAQFGATTAFQRSLPFPERDVLLEILPYLKKSLGLTDAEIFMVDEALPKAEAKEAGYTKSIVEMAEPGSPAFEFRNV